MLVRQESALTLKSTQPPGTDPALRVHFHGGLENLLLTRKSAELQSVESLKDHVIRHFKNNLRQPGLFAHVEGDSACACLACKFTHNNGAGMFLCNRSCNEFSAEDLDEVNNDEDRIYEIFVRHREVDVDAQLTFPKRQDLRPQRRGMNKIISQNAKNNIEIFFTELSDNTDQATVSITFPYGMEGRHIHFELRASERRVLVKDNGPGQDPAGLVRMARMAVHLEKEGHTGTRVGKYGIGFNAAVSSVSAKVLLESRQQHTNAVNILSFEDIETDASDPAADDWGGEEDFRVARTDDAEHYMLITLNDVRPDFFTDYISENGLADGKPSLGLDRKLINTYYLHIFPPAWASHVFSDMAPTGQRPQAPGNPVASGRARRGGPLSENCGPFDPYAEGERFLEPLSISFKLLLGEGGTYNRQTGLDATDTLSKVRDVRGTNVIEQKFTNQPDANLSETQRKQMTELKEETRVHQSIHPRLKAVNGKPNRALYLKFRFKRPGYIAPANEHSPRVGIHCEYAEIRLVLFYHPCDHGHEVRASASS